MSIAKVRYETQNQRFLRVERPRRIDEAGGCFSRSCIRCSARFAMWLVSICHGQHCAHRVGIADELRVHASFLRAQSPMLGIVRERLLHDVRAPSFRYKRIAPSTRLAWQGTWNDNVLSRFQLQTILMAFGTAKPHRRR
jgi:hypothetical protein